MRKIYNNRIPFKGYKAMALCPFIFIRNEYKDSVNDVTINHETIHFEQQKELSLIIFLIWYILEYIIKVFKYGRKAYKNIGFEREAYQNAKDFKYLENRKRYAFFKYFINKNKQYNK